MRNAIIAMLLAFTLYIPAPASAITLSGVEITGWNSAVAAVQNWVSTWDTSAINKPKSGVDYRNVKLNARGLTPSQELSIASKTRDANVEHSIRNMNAKNDKELLAAADWYDQQALAITRTAKQWANSNAKIRALAGSQNYSYDPAGDLRHNNYNQQVIDAGKR